MDRMQYRSLGGELLNDIDLYPLVEEVGQRPYPVARTDLQQMLQDAFPGEVKLNHKCIAVEEDEKSVTAIFENGHIAQGDLLIAADQVRSLLRQYVLAREVYTQLRRLRQLEWISTSKRRFSTKEYMGDLCW